MSQVVGEAPGAEEDRLGKPFVGRSGELLDKILAAVDLNRSCLLPHPSMALPCPLQ